MLRGIALLAAASAAIGVIDSAAASEPTVAQIKAAIATHSDNFVLANSFGNGGHPPGHGWIDVKTGAGRWVSANGKLVSLKSVALDPHDPAHVVVTETNINYTSRTWYRTKHEEPAKPPGIIDPLATAPRGVQFRLLGVESVDGLQTYHLRSTYFSSLGNDAARVDVWFSTDQAYLIRVSRTRGGKVIQRIDNHWLPRTSANLALLTTAIPSGFKQVFVSA